MEREYRRVYIEVKVVFELNGKMIPKSFRWEDGKEYEVDKVVDIRRAASLKAGGQGIRYTCRINGKEKYLFFDDYRWYVEAIV